MIQVDSHFCSNCLENIPSTEAKLRKNKCNSCFDCPSCHSTLSTRAHSVQVPMTSTESGSKEKEEKSGEAKMVSKKMYYLACLSCRWTSRDVGISDQPSQTFSWPEPEYSHATRFQLLLEHFQAVVLHEKQERQEYLKRKAPRTTKFPSMTVSFVGSHKVNIKFMNTINFIGSNWLDCLIHQTFDGIRESIIAQT